MIEKIMKAVKSGNKKRGRNITIGAVVGMLVSCTAVMGADNYLWIREDNGTIEYNTAITTDASGTDGNWNEANPYNQNEWNENTYINNAVLSSSGDNGKTSWGICYALKLSGDLNGKNFTNNGSITAGADSASSYFNYGIYNEGTIGVLTNDGLIAATLLENGSSSYGIYNEGTIGSLINNGSIISRLSGINVYACSIGSLINNGSITSKSGYGINVSSNAKITTLTNTGLVAGKQGIIVDDTDNSAKMTTLTNTGLIAGKDGVGIDVRPKLSNLTNTGVIIGTGKDYEAIGIINYGDNIETLKNIGLITGINTENYEGNGIHIHNNITALINNGLITGINRGSGESYGIVHKSELVSDLINNGLIKGITTGSGAGYGVYTSAGITTLTNTGAIYGATNAIKIHSTEINSLNNYGILATEGNSIKDGTITNENNYGLYITDTTGVVTAGSGGKETIKVGDLERDMTIKNATITAEGTSTTSLSFSATSNEFDNSILNGKNDTLKVSGTGHEILGSIINAYGTAIAFDTAGGELTLSGTNVNGSVEEISNSIIGSDFGDTLILQSGEIAYNGGATRTENTVINGNIDMKAGADTLTIGSGAVINGNVDMGDGADILNFVNGAQTNGTLNGGSGDDTLNFEKALSAKTVSSNDDEIRILHSISGFEN
ncbi:beta strand repeat-containing protein, partial [Fusobacterium ulcerans]|uniref:beta strand repeat-containing protein n=1 Tax=Fusobacterium ulcerans TaxID=861 RepID=UPI00387394A6|nr:autotransporter domain-containing protein [Fusobacterium ulcerans]MCB8650979.1 autotransporter domain-containing protein [Fusobacterium ulcerans]